MFCHKTTRAKRHKKAPQVGFEPTTDRLTADCSTTELLWNHSKLLIPDCFVCNLTIAASGPYGPRRSLYDFLTKII